MDWNAIGTQVILSIIGVVLTGLGSLFTYLINKYVKNEKLKTVVSSFDTLVKDSVENVYQTYVEALKKDGMFDEAAQKEALSKCLALIESNMSSDVLSWLNSNYADIESYIKDQIEAMIAKLKNGSK